MMRVVVTAATRGEWMPAFQTLQVPGTATEIYARMWSESSGTQADTHSRDFTFSNKEQPDQLNSASQAHANKGVQVIFHESGVGMLATAFSLTRLVLEEKPDLIIQVGIAGSFTQRPLSEVFVVAKEYAGDTGVLENNIWHDLFDLQLAAPNGSPFQDKALPNPWLPRYNILQLPLASAITVNAISTTAEHISRLKEKYQPDLESMEGAVLHYICRKMDTPFIQLRAVSNYVGVRDKKQWTIGPAISALNETLLEYMEKVIEI